MNGECRYNEITGKEPTRFDCEECIEKFDLPTGVCCLNSCGEYKFCKSCNVIDEVNNFIKEKK